MGKVRGFGNEREGRKTQERTSGLKLRMPKRSVTKPADKPLNPLMKTEGGGGGGGGGQARIMSCEPRCRRQERVVVEGEGRKSAPAPTNPSLEEYADSGSDWLNPKCQLQCAASRNVRNV
jgi:hypothetical protein